MYSDSTADPADIATETIETCLADPADIAAETIETCLADAERRARGKSAPEHHPDFDGVRCVEEACGIEIPAARLALGKVRCVECQTLLEKRR